MKTKPHAAPVISAGLRETARLLEQISGDSGRVSSISQAAAKLSEIFANKKKLLIAGNGGSAADAQHIAAELVHRYAAVRRAALPALALTTDSSILTAVSNDWGADEIFSRQVEAFGQSGDVLLLISTSGQSKNLLAAAKQAKKQGLYVIGLLGRDGGALRALCDLAIVVPGENTARIQEAHRCIYHLMCEQVEQELLS